MGGVKNIHLRKLLQYRMQYFFRLMEKLQKMGHFPHASLLSLINGTRFSFTFTTALVEGVAVTRFE